MSRFAIGVDLGGTNLRIAAIDEAGQMLEKVSLATKSHRDRETVLRDMCEAIQGVRAKLESAGLLAGVGVGVPGILYVETGVLRQSPNLPGWENFPVRAEIEALLKTSVCLDNDANVAALGEKRWGAGREVESLCMLTLGTGVGGGLILDGKIWHGFLGMAGELGHMVVAENGVRCACGGNGCLETESSGTAIVRKARLAIAEGRSPALAELDREGKEITAKLVGQEAKAGDAASREVFDSAGRYLGIGLANLVNALNLPLYVIGGGVANDWDLFAPAMLEELRRRSYIFCEGSTRVEQSVLKGDAGLYGAASLALQSDAPSV